MRYSLYRAPMVNIFTGETVAGVDGWAVRDDQAGRLLLAEETVIRLNELTAETTRTHEALALTKMGGIYDTFSNPADAISQMAQHIKELTAERNKLRELLTDEQVCKMYPAIEF